MLNPTQKSYLTLSNFYFAAALAILIFGVVYGIFQFRIMQAEGQAILDNVNTISQQETVKLKVEKMYQTLADTRQKHYEEYSKKMASILPPDENYTDLTRQFDAYFDQHDQPGNSIFQSSLRFGKGTPVPGMTYISALPVSTNIEATRDNFFKFLEFINNSGSLETETRLMEIKSIQINFPEGGEVVDDLKQKINFNVEMLAYYQTPKVAR